MYEEFRVCFSDGTSTLDWYGEDDWISDGGEQGFAADVAETVGMSASDVKSFERTGRTDDAH